MAPWKGPRHRSPWSDTHLATAGFVVVFGTYITWEIVGTAPQGLVSLLGIAGGAWFGAVSGDRKKRDADTERTANRADETANRAEGKADRLTTVAEAEHPQATHDAGLPPGEAVDRG